MLVEAFLGVFQQNQIRKHDPATEKIVKNVMPDPSHYYTRLTTEGQVLFLTFAEGFLYLHERQAGEKG